MMAPIRLTRHTMQVPFNLETETLIVVDCGKAAGAEVTELFLWFRTEW